MPTFFFSYLKAEKLKISSQDQEDESGTQKEKDEQKERIKEVEKEEIDTSQLGQEGEIEAAAVACEEAKDENVSRQDMIQPKLEVEGADNVGFEESKL